MLVWTCLGAYLGGEGRFKWEWPALLMVGRRLWITTFTFNEGYFCLAET